MLKLEGPCGLRDVTLSLVEIRFVGEKIAGGFCSGNLRLGRIEA